MDEAKHKEANELTKKMNAIKDAIVDVENNIEKFNAKQPKLEFGCEDATYINLLKHKEIMGVDEVFRWASNTSRSLLWGYYGLLQDSLNQMQKQYEEL